MNTFVQRMLAAFGVVLIIYAIVNASPARAGDQPNQAAAKAACEQALAYSEAPHDPPNVTTSPCTFYSDHHWEQGGSFAYCFSAYTKWSVYGYNDNDFKYSPCTTFDSVDSPPPVDPEKNRGEPKCPCEGIGDPVHPGTGSKYDRTVLYHGQGSFPLDLVVNYDGMSGVSSALNRRILGVQRSHSYMRAIVLGGDLSYAYALRSDGKTYTFRRKGNNWVGDADVHDALSAQYGSDGSASAWTYRTEDGDIESYDSHGLLSSIARHELIQKLSRDSSGRVDTVSDPEGRTITFGYRSDGFLDHVDTPDGRIAFQYDSRAFLYNGLTVVTRITWPDSTHRDYLYAEQGKGSNLYAYDLTGVVDESEVRIDSTSYDDQERVVLDQGASVAGSSSIAYSTSAEGHSRVTVTNPLGDTQQIDFLNFSGVPLPSQVIKSCDGCTAQILSYNYDAAGQLIRRVEANGSITAFTYDGNGLPLSMTRGQDTPDAVTTQTTWDVNLRKPLTRTTAADQGRSAEKNGWSYDAAGNVTAECLIDISKAPSYICDPSGSVPDGVRRTVMSYCTTADGHTCPLVGLLLAVDGPRTDVSDLVHYTYYLTTDESSCGTAAGPCHHLGDLQSVTSGAGLTMTYVAYDKAGRPTRIKAPNGALTDLTYTPRGWLASRTLRANVDGSASTADATTALTYNPDGTLHQFVDPDGVTTTYTYDAAHRLTDITDGNGAHVHYTLDAAGNRTAEQALSSSGGVVRASSRTYNPLGQLTAVTDGLGRTTFSASSDSYDANGNLVQSQDGLGIQQKQVFDGLNRLISTIRNYQGSDTATANAQSVTSYDALDRVIGFSDPDGLNTTYDIDGLGNVTGLHSPDTGTTARTFDIAGNVATSTDAMQVASTSTYDADNRLSATRYADTTANVQYKYDEADSVTGCTGSYGKGHLTRIVESKGGLVFCYDGRGNVVAKRQTVGTKTTTTAYTWTLGNRLSATVTPNGTTIRYTRDALGNITTVTATQGGVTTTVVSNAVYMPFGPLSSYQLGDGQTVTRTFDATGALTDIDSTAFSLHMKRDVMGNITAIGDAPGVPTALETYGYDALYRLTGVNAGDGNAVEAYTYNATGDRLSKVAPGMLTGTYTYKTGTHQLTGVGTTTRQVDARGNTTANVLASGTYGFGYNPRNRLTVVQNNGTTVGSYVLNALGQRVQKVVGGVTTRFDYDEASRLLGESNGAATRDYVWMNGMPVGIVDHVGNASTAAFVHADGLGSPRVVTNANGAVIWQWAYAGNPFGEKAPVSTSDYVLNLRYPGQYFDAENGLNYNVNRDYESATGRYMESDPIGLDGGMTTYGYVDQNPFASVDPLGLQAVCLACHNGVLPGFPGPVPLPPPAQSLPSPSTGSVPDTGEGVGDVTKPGTCPPDKPCPPCRTVSGMTIPVGTIAYRLDILPDDVRQHGIYGSHYNLYKANQAPRNSARPCKCFWQPIGAVSASEPVFGSIPIENFAE